MKEATYNEIGVCSICGDPYWHWGNNPEPVKKYEERCCHKCHWEIVVPIRMKLSAGSLGTWAERLKELGYPSDPEHQAWPRNTEQGNQI